MAQPAFNIGNTDQAMEVPDGHLLIEISAQSLNYILFKKDPQQLLLLRQYRLYTTSDRLTSDLIDEVIAGDTLLQQHGNRALIVYNFPESNIFPAEYYNNEIKSSITKLVYGDASNDLVFEEKIRDTNMYNMYRIPKDIHLLLREKFSGSSYWHFYTLILLSQDNTYSEKENVLRTVFYHDKFICAFFIKGNLQIIQTFNYQTPEDVAYYLLLICKQFAISPDNLALFISGLIDSQSALYSELMKYFSEVYEEKIPEGIEINGLLEEFPAHYFSPLLKMSLCGL